MAPDMQDRLQLMEASMGKLLEKIKKKILSSTLKKDAGQKGIKTSKTFPKQKAPLK